MSHEIIVIGEEQRFLSLIQLREMPEEAATFLLKQLGRNTADYLTITALQVTEHGYAPILFLTPADQTEVNEPDFKIKIVPLQASWNGLG
jgi:mannose-1-phosphate guanylyltransferase